MALTEVLIVISAIILAALYLAKKIAEIAQDREMERRINECTFSLNRITAQVVIYSSGQNKSLEQCQAINIMIDAWNMRCNELPGFQKLPKLTCP